MGKNVINDLCCLIDAYLETHVGPEYVFILHVAGGEHSYTTTNLPTLREVPRILRCVSEKIEMETIRNN